MKQLLGIALVLSFAMPTTLLARNVVVLKNSTDQIYGELHIKCANSDCSQISIRGYGVPEFEPTQIVSVDAVVRSMHELHSRGFGAFLDFYRRSHLSRNYESMGATINTLLYFGVYALADAAHSPARLAGDVARLQVFNKILVELAAACNLNQGYCSNELIFDTDVMEYHRFYGILAHAAGKITSEEYIDRYTWHPLGL